MVFSLLTTYFTVGFAERYPADWSASLPICTMAVGVVLPFLKGLMSVTD
jgi:hypothetical protein